MEGRAAVRDRRSGWDVTQAQGRPAGLRGAAAALRLRERGKTRPVMQRFLTYRARAVV